MGACRTFDAACPSMRVLHDSPKRPDKLSRDILDLFGGEDVCAVVEAQHDFAIGDDGDAERIMIAVVAVDALQRQVAFARWVGLDRIILQREQGVEQSRHIDGTVNVGQRYVLAVQHRGMLFLDAPGKVDQRFARIESHAQRRCGDEQAEHVFDAVHRRLASGSHAAEDEVVAIDPPCQDERPCGLEQRGAGQCMAADQRIDLVLEARIQFFFVVPLLRQDTRRRFGCDKAWSFHALQIRAPLFERRGRIRLCQPMEEAGRTYRRRQGSGIAFAIEREGSRKKIALDQPSASRWCWVRIRRCSVEDNRTSVARIRGAVSRAMRSARSSSSIVAACACLSGASSAERSCQRQGSDTVLWTS